MLGHNPRALLRNRAAGRPRGDRRRTRGPYYYYEENEKETTWKVPRGWDDHGEYIARVWCTHCTRVSWIAAATPDMAKNSTLPTPHIPVGSEQSPQRRRAEHATYRLKSALGRMPLAATQPVSTRSMSWQSFLHHFSPLKVHWQKRT